MFVKFPKIIISDCPHCKGRMTGFFVLRTSENDIKRRCNFLRKGQRISVLNDIKVPYLNCFCRNCGYEWHEKISYKWITREEWKSYFDSHYFLDEINTFNRSINKDVSKKEKKVKRKERRKFVFCGVLLLFGISPGKLNRNLEYLKKKSKINKEIKALNKEERDEKEENQ